MPLAVKAGLIVAFVLHYTDGLALTAVGSGVKFSASTWLEYVSGRGGLPDCCAAQDCSMVRINEKLVSWVKRNGPGSFSAANGQSLVLKVQEYDTMLGGIRGTITKNGQLYRLEPTTLGQRKMVKCGISSQRTRMNLFHTLVKGAEPVAPAVAAAKSSASPLDVPYLLTVEGPAPHTCCGGSAVCLAVQVDQAALHSTAIRLPGAHLEDITMVLGLTFPKTNCHGYCSAYYFRGQDNPREKLKVDLVAMSMALSGGATDFSLSECQGVSVWASAPPAQASAQQGVPVAVGGRSTPVVDSDCWYNQTKYCDPAHHQVAPSQVAQGINCEAMSAFCHQQCLEIQGCNYFTFYQGRLTARCTFHSECQEIRNAGCLAQENCLSGEADCDGAVVGPSCTAPITLDNKFTPWMCTDIDGNLQTSIPATLPLGSTCVQRCGNWVDNSGNPGYLESTCSDTGVWTETAVQNGDASLALPLGPYAEPDDHINTGNEPLQVCSCQPLELRWPPEDPAGYTYDPNHEEGAEFVCDVPLTNSSGPVTLAAGNECVLFCDNRPFVNLRCVDGEWTGHPERGVWCFTRPDGNGTCGDNCIGTWQEWGEWSDCDMTNAGTGFGTERRTRTCTGGICEGGPAAGAEARNCNGWSDWGTCDAFTGTQTRSRAGGETETRDCDVDGGWSDWGAYSACVDGSKTRSRTCNNPQKWNNGADCSDVPVGATQTDICPVAGGYTDWTPWSILDEASWTSTRTRTCTNPEPKNGGLSCIAQNLGDATETVSSTLDITITVTREIIPDPVPNPTAQVAGSASYVTGGSDGIIYVYTISGPSSYIYNIGATGYFSKDLVVDLNTDYSSCETSYTISLYKKHPTLLTGQIAVYMYWLSDAEDLDLNVFVAPRQLTEPTCRQYWGREGAMCQGIKQWSDDAKLPNNASRAAHEYAVVDGTLDVDYAFGPEDALVYHGVNLTVENEAEIVQYELKPQAQELPHPNSGWFAGCVQGPAFQATPATNDGNDSKGNPVFNQPQYIDHQDLEDWTSDMKLWCSAAVGRRWTRWNYARSGASSMDRFDFDCDKNTGPCH